MSADNVIYVGRWDDGYRIAHHSASLNFNHEDPPDYLFKDSGVYHTQQDATDCAYALEEQIGYVEYGIEWLNTSSRESFGKFDPGISLQLAQPEPQPMNLTITLDPDAIKEGIKKALNTSPSVMRPNPIFNVLSDACNNALPQFHEWAKDHVTSVLEDEDFAAQVQRKFRESFLQEAENMGRKAARAVINAKDGKL